MTNTPPKTENFQRAIEIMDMAIKIAQGTRATIHVTRANQVLKALQHHAIASYHPPQPCDDLLKALEYADKELTAIYKEISGKYDITVGQFGRLETMRAAIAKYKATQGMQKRKDEFVTVPMKDIVAMRDCIMQQDNGVCDTIWLYPGSGISITLYDYLQCLIEDSSAPTTQGETS